MTQDDEAGGLPAFLSDPRGVLQRRWPWLGGVAAVGIVATAIYVSQVPVTFLATATLVFNSQKISNQFVAPTADPMAQLDAVVGAILSRDQFGPLVERHNLYPQLRAKVPMAALIGIARGNVVVLPEGSMLPSRGGSTARLFTISFRDLDPLVAAAMANDLAAKFTAAAGKATGEAARTTETFMAAERDRSQRELRAKEREIAEFKAKYRGELPSELAPNTSKLERIAIQRQTLAAQLEAAETRLDDLEKLGDLANPSSPYSRLAALRSKLVSELAANTEEHPNVIALRRQIEALEKEIAGGAKPSGNPAEDIALRTERELVSDLRAQIADLTAETAQLEERVSRTPQREEDLAGLTQMQTVLHETYISNLRKLEAAQLALKIENSQDGSRVEILDRAVPPSEPERTRLKLLLAGFAASILGGVAVALLLELIDPVIVSVQQIEDEIGLRVLGSIGRIG